MNDYTYIAADYDNDQKAVEVLYKMKENGYIHFKDAHELQQSNDSSLACSIKKSLKYRMDNSYRFVLVVGKHTNTITKGGCQICDSYNSHTYSCARGYNVDYNSFVKFECENAVKNNMNIIVLYKDTTINRELCPESIRMKGHHQRMWKRGEDGKIYWDYSAIASVFNN